MKAKEMLIATPLLKWYILHGIKVDNIHEVVEFNSAPCFQTFVSAVTEARRMGDVDASKAVIADTMKLIGNSAFGSMIMNKKKHKNVYYVKGAEEARKAVNEASFERLHEIDSDYFEIEAFKKCIVLNLPTQIGYFILQYAKLRMLEFYYDFMDQFVDRDHYEYLEMDTDSAYMAIASENFADIIKPEFRKRFQQCLNGFCNDGDFKADSEMHWFPRTCCNKHGEFDKRTPGLFKT